ncbi:MAG: PilT protein domain protein [Myxococcaceae bacterium]|nr:PilT protein domain protein [Myxococcaceae bacterium]
MSAFTLDTGALLALERRRQRTLAFLAIAKADKIPLVVPSVCIAEWWRGRTDVREKILATVIVEHTDDELVKLAGVALAAVPKATCIDAIVMASAARRGGIVITSDVEDLTRLRAAFPGVRVLGA